MIGVIESTEEIIMNKNMPKQFNQVTMLHHPKANHNPTLASLSTHKRLSHFKVSRLTLGLVSALGLVACQNQTVQTQEAPSPTTVETPQHSAQKATVQPTTTPASAAQLAKPSSLIVRTEYLDYTLPEAVSNTCDSQGNCPEIDIEYVSTNQPWVTEMVNAQINTIAYDNADISQDQEKQDQDKQTVQKKISAAVLKAMLDKFTKAQLAELPEESSLNYSLQVAPHYLGHLGNIELFELTSYLYLGGAHGMPYTEYLLLDAQAKKRLTLDDLLIETDTAKAKFEALAHDAFKSWIKEMDGDIKEHEEMWPFFLTDNVSLNDNGVVLKYQAYDIGAYVYGQPELVIPYSQLNGVIKPEFLLE